MGKKLTPDYFRAVIRKLDPKCEEDSESFETAVILLASTYIGPNSRKIAKFLDIPLSKITPRAKNLRESGIWKNGKIYCDWTDKKSGGVAFWCDTLVADGLIKRVEQG